MSQSASQQHLIGIDFEPVSAPHSATVSPRVVAGEPRNDSDTVMTVQQDANTNSVSHEVHAAIRAAIADSSAELGDSVRRGVVAGVDDAIANMRVQLQNELNNARAGADDSVLHSWLATFLDPIRVALDKLVGSTTAAASTPTAAAVTTAAPPPPPPVVSPPSPRGPPVPVYFVSWDRRDGLKREREIALQRADDDAKASDTESAAVVCWSHLAPSPADQLRLRGKFASLHLFFVSTEEMCGSASTRSCSSAFFELNEWLVARGLPKLID
jgi:hypothetical protein